MEFIAIGGNHQPVMGLGTPGNKQQAHVFLAGLGVLWLEARVYRGSGAHGCAGCMGYD